MSVVARIRVPDPIDVIVAYHAVWVRTAGHGPNLWKIDPATAGVERRIDTGLSGAGWTPTIAAAAHSIWVLNADRSVVRVSAETGRVIARISLGTTPSTITSGFGSVWTTAERDLLRIDPGTDRVDSRIGLPATPISLTRALDGMWVLTYHSLLRIDPYTNTIADHVSLRSRNPSLVASGSSWIWVANRSGDGTADQVNPKTGRVFRTVPLAWLRRERSALGAPMGFTVGNGIAWSNTGDVRGMDVMSGRVVADVPVGEGVDTTAGIATIGRSVWVVDPADQQLVELRARVPRCRKVEGSFRPRLLPASGRPGAVVTVSGRTPYTTESGQYRPGDVTEVQLWWNVHAWAYTSVLPGFDPRTAGPGPVELVGDIGTLGMCAYRASFRIPDVPAGRYPVSAVEFGGGGAASLGAGMVTVTR
jgi:hypothetical protein